MNQKKQTKRSVPVKSEQAVIVPVVATYEDAVAITAETAAKFEGDLYYEITDKKATQKQLVQLILDKLNNDKEWRAWAAVLMYKRVAK